MVGRASLIVILGFSLIFGLAGQYWNRESDSATENFVNYYSSSAAHNIAVGAANLACDSIFQNSADTAVINGLSGTFPGGGSYMIASQMQPGIYGSKNVAITAIGIYAGFEGNPITDTIRVLLATYKFSRFAMYDSSDHDVYWTTGDTLTGPFQTDGNMYVSGVPVIKGPVTIGGATYSDHNGRLSQPKKTNLPDPYGDTLKANSFLSGVNVQMPQTMDYSSISSATSTISQTNYTGSNSAFDVYLTFNSNGTVTETDTTRQYTSSGRGRGNWSVVATNSSSLSGKNTALTSLENSEGQTVILVANGDVHVSGVVNGDVTVVGQQGSGSTARHSYTGNSTGAFSSASDGNVMITGDLTYRNNPQTDPASNDMLGLVATNNVMLTTQPPGNITIDAAIFARNGSFLYQGYSSTRGTTSNGNYNTFAGYIDLYGSLSQKVRGAIGQVSGTGYLKDYKYDPRFARNSPPAFPGTSQYRVISWEG